MPQVDLVPRALIDLDLQDVLLRGCRLKNSQFVLGLAVFTGSETRIQLNTRRAPLKSGAYDQFLNVQITALIALQVILCAPSEIAALPKPGSTSRRYPNPEPPSCALSDASAAGACP